MIIYLINTNKILYNDYKIYQGIDKDINNKDKETFINIVNNNINNKNISDKMKKALMPFKNMVKSIINSFNYRY